MNVSIQLVDSCVLLQFRNTVSNSNDEIETFISRLSDYFELRFFRSTTLVDFVDSSQHDFGNFEIDSSVDR
jgi:hypothetical protein